MWMIFRLLIEKGKITEKKTGKHEIPKCSKKREKSEIFKKKKLLKSF